MQARDGARFGCRSAFLCVASAALALGCGRGDPQDLPAYPVFDPAPAGRSVLASGHPGEPAIVSDPSVYADAEGYHLFFTSLFCLGRADSAPTWLAVTQQACSDIPKGSTGYAYSSDRGLTWELRATPVVYPRADAWDSGDIESPFATRWNDELVLLYSAFGAIDARFEMGLATLALGARTVREAMLDDELDFVPLEAPLIPADFSVPGAINNAQEPSAVVRQDAIEVYYVAIGLTRPELGFVPEQLPTGIGLRRRRFARGWVELPGSDEALLDGINIAEVIERDGVLDLFSTSLEDTDDHRAEKLLWHRSTDAGKSFGDAVLALDFGHGRVDEWGIMAPSVVLEPDRAVLFYTAWESSAGPCMEDVRFGMADALAERCLYSNLGRAESKR